VKDLHDLLPYMDADVNTFSDYSVNHQMAPARLQLRCFTAFDFEYFCCCLFVYLFR